MSCILTICRSRNGRISRRCFRTLLVLNGMGDEGGASGWIGGVEEGKGGRRTEAILQVTLLFSSLTEQKQLGSCDAPLESWATNGEQRSEGGGGG